MKSEQLKLYNKYKYKNNFISKQFIVQRNLNFDQIVKDLNLELNENGNIKDYEWIWLYKEYLQDLKPILKDKLINLLNI